MGAKVPRPHDTNVWLRNANKQRKIPDQNPSCYQHEAVGDFTSSTMIYARPTLSRYDYRIAAEQSHVSGGVRA